MMVVNDDAQETDTVNDVSERAKIILEQSNLLFNRLEGSRTSLKNQVTTFFAIFITTITLQLTFLQLTFSIIGNLLSNFEVLILFIPFLIVMIMSGIQLFPLFWSTKYLELNIFGHERFEQLASLKKDDLLSDILYYLRESYKNNFNELNTDSIRFKKSILLFSFGNLYLILIYGTIIIYTKFF